MTEVEYSIKCTDCGHVFEGEKPTQENQPRKPCPKCGSLRRTAVITARETMVLHEFVGLKAKIPGSKHRRGGEVLESGEGVKAGKDGRLVYKRFLRDRRHPGEPETYVEVVKDLDGNVKENKHEKLSEHG